MMRRLDFPIGQLATMEVKPIPPECIETPIHLGHIE